MCLRSFSIVPILVVAACAQEAVLQTDAGGEGADGAVDASIDAHRDGGSTALDAGEPVDRQALFEALKERISAEMVDSEAPGVGLAVVVDGHTYAAGLGIRELGTTEAVTEETPFRIMSLTKTVTAIAVMKLVDWGMLDLDEPIGGYLPGLSFVGRYADRDLTAHHLLTHTAGLGWPFDADPSLAQSSHPDALAAFLQSDLPVWSPPGAIFSYQNLGYSLLGLLGQQLYWAYYPDYVEAEVLEPLGLTSSGFDSARLAASASSGHSRLSGADARTIAPGPWPTASLPNGGMYSSAKDLAGLARVFLEPGRRILSEEAVAAMMHPYVDSQTRAFNEYGYGLWSFYVDDIRFVGHTGGAPGGNVSFVVAPDHDFAVVALSNADWFNSVRITNRAISTFLGVEPEDPGIVTTDPATWAPFEGRYDGGDLGQIDVVRNLGQLLVRFADRNHASAMRQLEAQTFAFVLNEEMAGDFAGQRQSTATFYRAEDGRTWFVSPLGIGVPEE